jgi:hypothetical protein
MRFLLADEAGISRGRNFGVIRESHPNLSPVDVSLDGVGLRPRVDCALDAGYGGVPCLINIAGLELNLDYLPAL